MKNKPRLVSIVLFISTFILLVSWGRQKVEWKGTIEEDNGIIVVKNAKDQGYGEDVFSLVEELSIGESKEGEEYMFSEIESIAVDDEERIYVSDSEEKNVKNKDKMSRLNAP